MLKDTFLHIMKTNCLKIGDYILFRKPCTLWNSKTDSEVDFKSVEDAYNNAIIDGKPLKEIVEESDISIFNITIDDTDLKIK